MTSVTTSVTDRLPKAFRPRSHAFVDYLMLAGALAAAPALFRRNRTAGACAIIAAIAEGANVALTDFPGGVFKTISFPLHGRLGLGTAAMTASMPKLMNFDKEPEARFFQLYSLAAVAVIGLTDFTGTGKTKQVRELVHAEV
jgi:hypothetical protein